MTAERSESEGFYEMLWDCDHCGAKGLLGKSQRHCAECGAPQNPDKRYFPSPEQQQQVVGHTYEGADHRCPSCNAPMSAKCKNCTQCGAPMDGSKIVQGVEDKPAQPKKKSRLWKILAIVAVAVAAISFAIWFLFIRKHDATLTVASHRWERVIPIEEYNIHHAEAWRNELPVGAELPVCHPKPRTTKQVPDGETCHTERHNKNDGTFEQVKKCVPKYRSEPVDDDWCSYSIRKWAKVDEAKSSGTGTSPTSPTQPLPPATVAQAIGARRQGKMIEKLVLDFGEPGTCEVDDATWRKYKDGQKVKLEVRARSGDVVCSGL